MPPPTDPAGLLAATERFVDEVVRPRVAEWERSDSLPPTCETRSLELGLPGAMARRSTAARG